MQFPHAPALLTDENVRQTQKYAHSLMIRSLYITGLGNVNAVCTCFWALKSELASDSTRNLIDHVLAVGAYCNTPLRAGYASGWKERHPDAQV